MMLLHVICSLPPSPPIKNPAYAYGYKALVLYDILLYIYDCIAKNTVKYFQTHWIKLSTCSQ